MASQRKAIVSAISGGDLAALSSLPNVRNVLDQPLYGTYSQRFVTVTNPLPLQLAVLFNQREVVDYVLKSGADPNQVHPQSDSPPAVHIAVVLSLAPLVQALASRGASLELPNAEGLTPLHSALLHSDLPTFQMLLNFGANVAAVDPNGDTVIHSAIKHQKTMQAQYLAQNPAYLNLMNSQGIPAFQLIQAPRVTPPQPQVVAVEAARYDELKNHVTALEFALSRITAGRDPTAGTCPICRKHFENNEWVLHVRAGCAARG
jgi:ankyrin repeat protein